MVYQIKSSFFDLYLYLHNVVVHRQKNLKFILKFMFRTDKSINVNSPQLFVFESTI